MSPTDLLKKSLVVVTGASRGIGRAIAIEIARITHPKSTLILIASSEKGLEETKLQIAKINSSSSVFNYPLDLSSPTNNYDKLFDIILKKADVSDLENAVMIHNAGTVGILKKTLDLTDLSEWKKFYDLNTISAFLLNGSFVRKTKVIAKKLTVINISSKCGHVPFLNMAMYASAKAAREMFFKVLALEEPEILVLNYSPGPVDTDMFSSVIVNAQHEELRKGFKKALETNILQPKQTVNVMLDILKKGDFKTGDFLDYFGNTY